MSDTLYLLRHGATACDPGASDRQRYLTQAGRDQCRRVANFLETNDHVGFPDIIISSGVRRTNDTARALIKNIDHLSDDTIQSDERLYRGDAQTYLNVIREYGDAVDKVMIIGHNPTIYQLALNLADGCPNAQLKNGYPPATLTVFTLQNLANLDGISEMIQFIP